MTKSTGTCVPHQDGTSEYADSSQLQTVKVSLTNSPIYYLPIQWLCVAIATFGKRLVIVHGLLYVSSYTNIALPLCSYATNLTCVPNSAYMYHMVFIIW